MLPCHRVSLVSPWKSAAFFGQYQQLPDLVSALIDVSKQMTIHTARGILNGCGSLQRHRSEEENQQCLCMCLPDDVLAAD